MQVCRKCLESANIVRSLSSQNVQAMTTPQYRGSRLQLDSQEPSAPAIELMETDQPEAAALGTPPQNPALQPPYQTPPPYNPGIRSPIQNPSPASSGFSGYFNSPPPRHIRPLLQPYSPSDHASETTSSQSSEDWLQSSQYISGERRDALNTLIRLNKHIVPNPSIIDSTWRRIGK